MLHALASGQQEIEIWGDGQQTRSFMYIEDCLRGIDAIMHSDIQEPINLGCREFTRRGGRVRYHRVDHNEGAARKWKLLQDILRGIGVKVRVPEDDLRRPASSVG